MSKQTEALKLALEYITQSGFQTGINEVITAIREALAEQPAQQREPVALITPLMEQQMFDDWCPYKGSPDPRTVWAAAIEAVNGLLLGASPPASKPLTDGEIDLMTSHIYHRGRPVDRDYRICLFREAEAAHGIKGDAMLRAREGGAA